MIKRKIINLNAEIKSFYFSKKQDSVQKGILPGNSRSLWSAVKIAKDTGTDEIPLNMSYKGEPVASDEVAESFAHFVEEKQTFTSRQKTFSIFKTNSTKVGLNILANRLSVLNGKIPLHWLNGTIISFKLHCKKLFLCD